ncbi:MAG: hypothetical protein Q8R28_15480, partial [Dehalococcoidia bacterium]|nr:hypothetical protein [Dehalococcoidia bacterium]
LEETWEVEGPLGKNIINYRYVADWLDAAKTQPASYSWRSKIFKRHGFTWQRPVHEIPAPQNGTPLVHGYCEGMVVYHYQEGTRDYTRLLSHLIADDPQDANARIQRAAEHMRHGRWQEALIDHGAYLELTRKEEHSGHGAQRCERCELIQGRRAYIHLDMARAKQKLGHGAPEILRHLLFAAAEAPHMREPWVYLADGFQTVGNWPGAYGAVMTGLGITRPGVNAQDMVCWGNAPQQLADRAFTNVLMAAAEKPTI